MKYEFKLVSATTDSDILNINHNLLDYGWEVVASVSQHMSGTNSTAYPSGGLFVFILRRELKE